MFLLVARVLWNDVVGDSRLSMYIEAELLLFPDYCYVLKVYTFVFPSIVNLSFEVIMLNLLKTE
jgi:hypothetical protein